MQKWKTWQISLAFHLFPTLHFTGCRGYILIPAIGEWWTWQREQLVQEFLNKELVICGDGQCDSPGHTVKNLCYFLMEIVSGYILEVEVRDKHHVGLASSNMEKQALQNALQWLQASLNVVEVVTDASTSIKKLLGEYT